MTDDRYDVIVVGARVAGSATAMLLARQGLRVLVVDRAAFPSDTISTHQVQLPGVSRLQRWGLLDQVEAAGTPATRHVRFATPYAVLDGHFPTFDGVDAVFSPRRTLLDRMLVDAARQAGAEVREGFTVDELVVEEGTVTGIRGRAGNGPSITESARLVVGADGKHSMVAKAVDAPVALEVPPLTVTSYTYWRDLPVEGGDLFFGARRTLGMWPTNDGLTMTFLQWPIAEFDAYREDIEGNLVRTIEGFGLGERVHDAERAERIRTTPDVPNVVRVPHGSGWALVGDAGLVMDPGTGQGIADAFRDAELLTSAIVRGSDHGGDPDAELAGYHAARDRAVLPMWSFTTELARMGPAKPEERVLFEALATNQAETDRFLGVITGAVPIRDYMKPGNLRKIVGMRGFAKIALGKARASRAA
jgi:2-polyprenyl-6-methoxyphenol hydroxylase-like FAD-dependent oxidoreductase